MKYEAIVFDYGNVIAGNPGKTDFLRLLTAIGTTREEYDQAYFAHNKKVNRGEISWEELWRLVLKDLGKEDRYEAVLAINREHKASLDNLNTDVIGLAQKLKTAGYKIGVLSNTTLEGARNIHRQLAPYEFDAINCSSETGLVKPEPAAFASIAAALGINLKSMVFVDDSERSLSTAAECGYTPILFTGYEQLAAELTRLHIL